MTPRFLIIAAVMVLLALACVLVPMLRSARREGRPRGPFVLALLLALLVPPAVLGGYLLIGTPQALEATAAPQQENLADATQQLRDSLAKNPNDPKGWALLAQAYAALGQPEKTLAALDHVIKLTPDDPDALVAWAQARAATHSDHLIDDAARASLQHALQLRANDQRALWLLGISDFQRQHYEDAIDHWNTLLPLLQPGSKVAASVQQELAAAQARLGQPARAASVAAVAAPASARSSAQAAASAGLHIEVRLDPKFAAKVQAGDTVFVFARAIDGPPMPLAVARIKASALPAQVTLGDAQAMAPTLRLSNFARVSVTARISKSGDASPQAGDFEATPVDVATRSRVPVTVTIDHAD